MAPQDDAAAKQPFHDVEGRPLPEAERILARHRAQAGEMALAGIRAVLEECRAVGAVPIAAGILESSGRRVDSLATILSSHALIHSADGDHFRDALAEACGALGLEVVRVRAKDLNDRSANALGRAPQEIQASIRTMGAPLGAPWGADQKASALLAWMILETRTL